MPASLLAVASFSSSGAKAQHHMTDFSPISFPVKCPSRNRVTPVLCGQAPPRRDEETRRFCCPRRRRADSPNDPPSPFSPLSARRSSRPPRETSARPASGELERSPDHIAPDSSLVDGLRRHWILRKSDFRLPLRSLFIVGDVAPARPWHTHAHEPLQLPQSASWHAPPRSTGRSDPRGWA